MKPPRFAFLAWTSSALAIVLLSAPTGRAQNVIAWGNGSQGQTNVPPSATNVVAVAAGEWHSLAQRSDGTVICWGSGAATNIPPNVTNAIAIAAGVWHSVVLLANNRVAAWGDNWYHQTDFPAGATNVIALAAGYFHTLALRADGKVVAWGDNSYGQINVPASLRNVVAIAAGDRHSIALTSDGALVSWGGGTTPPYRYATNSPPWTITDIVAIAAGESHNLGIKPGGEAFTWGYTADQPSIPASATNLVAIAVGAGYNLSLSFSGTILAWGNGEVTNVPPSATNIIAMASGPTHGLAVIGDGSPRIHGGIAYRTKVSVGDPLPLFARAVGQDPISYQWTSNGTPLVSFNAALPQIPAVLGTDNVTYQVVVTNSLGAATSSVAKVAVRAINISGRNTDGQRAIPESVTNPVCISAGGFHALALNARGTVSAWGKNWYGQTNVPASATNVVAIAAGGNHSLALKGDGSVLAWGLGWDGRTNVPPEATNVTSVAAGLAHSIVLRGDGTLVAWGNDDFGQTDVPSQTVNVIAIAAGYYHNIALRSDGTVATWGWEVPVHSGATNVVAVAAGWEHCLALRADGSVVAWGDNTYGESEVPESATNVAAIAAGWYHNMALRTDGTILAWGRAASSATDVPFALSGVESMAVGEDYNIAIVHNGPPQFGSQIASVFTHAGGEAILSANVQGPYRLTFQWYHDGELVPGATNRLLWLPACQMTNAGHYVLAATNAFGGATNQAVNLVVQPEPFFPDNTVIAQTVLVGGPTNLSLVIYGDQPMTYQWQLNGLDVPGATNAALSLPFANWTNAGVYRLVASNWAASVTGPPIVLTVLRTPLYFDTSPGGILVSNDGTHLRVLGASGVGPVVILASGDLQAWEPIQTNPPAIGVVEFIDPEAGNPAGRFYRAVEGSAAGPLRIDIEPSLSQPSNAALPLQLTGLTANGPVIIYASSNLLDWSAIFTNPPTVGPLQYREAPPSGQPVRFYRASEDRRP